MSNCYPESSVGLQCFPMFQDFCEGVGGVALPPSPLSITEGHCFCYQSFRPLTLMVILVWFNIVLISKKTLRCSSLHQRPLPYTVNRLSFATYMSGVAIVLTADLGLIYCITYSLFIIKHGQSSKIISALNTSRAINCPPLVFRTRHHRFPYLASDASDTDRNTSLMFHNCVCGGLR